MEPAKIDWKTVNSIFIEDDLYEHINAPQWIDFSAPQDSIVDDEAWFCRPECNHPKTVEDFLRESSKLQRSASVPEILPLGDRNRRDANLKWRGLTQPSNSPKQDPKFDKFVEDGENRNPNFSTPSRQYNAMKATIKSSTAKKESENSSKREGTPRRLRSTQSARNLFGGRDILNQITEFCGELKRLATRPREREREDVERLIAKKSPVDVKKKEGKDCSGGECLGDLDEREKERKPLLEVRKEKWEAKEKSNVKEKLMRKKRVDEAENIPISVDLKNIRRKEEEIRTCPPSPQCFSAGRGPTKAAPLKASRCRPPERGILQELHQRNKEMRNEEPDEKLNRATNSSIVADKEERTLDVFWFLKPCTTLSS